MARPTLAQRLFWSLLSVVFLITVVPVLRLSARGHRQLPRREPYLLLSNHVAWVDPFAVAYFCGRRVHFMASAHWFDVPVLRFFLELLGAFPKMKFTRDRNAMEALAAWYAAGEVVSLFPEGRRSWDGRTVPVLPRIGRLVKRLDCPVVFCRILTGHYHQPRWARTPRWAPLRLEYEGPVRFPADMTEEEVEAEIQRRITVDPDAVAMPRWTWGWRLAAGLPNLLWACPACFQLEGLREDPVQTDVVRCRACGAGWRVDVGQRLHPVAGPAEPLTVSTAWDRVRERFGAPPRAVSACGDPEVLLEDPGAVAAIGRGGVRTELARGRLQVTAETVRVMDGAGLVAWSWPLASIGAVSIEGGATLQLRSAEGLVRIEPDDASVVKWQEFLMAWRPKAA